MPHNATVVDNFVRAYALINSPKYEKILVSISGGADSDVVLDICVRCDKDKKCDYVWINTGLEYQATKDHLDYLEKKYEIKIMRVRPKKPVPIACKEYGQPFISKKFAEYIHRLQLHNFEWTDEPYEVLIEKYPHCKSALMWWCNMNRGGMLNISNRVLLKEFMIANPPTFKISAACCQKSKKDPLHKLLEGYDLNIYGVRKAEGGARQTAYKSCFDDNFGETDNYRPLFWYKETDKEEYCCHCDIEHSACYTEYGLRRTGCCGCPFGLNYEEEREIVRKYEPKLYVAINNIFKESYEYTRKYHEFVRQNR